MNAREVSTGNLIAYNRRVARQFLAKTAERRPNLQDKGSIRKE